jgi:hypothetical protein
MKKEHEGRIQAWLVEYQQRRELMSVRLARSNTDYPVVKDDLQEDAILRFKLWREGIWERMEGPGLQRMFEPQEWIVTDAELKARQPCIR